MKLPSIKELYVLCRDVKRQITNDCRASDDPDDNKPGISLTVGVDTDKGTWSYQTGDNSFSGGAYGYPHWGVVSIYRNSNCREVARDIIEQVADLASQ